MADFQPTTNSKKAEVLTTQQLLGKIESGFKVCTGEGKGSPSGFLSQFHTINDKISNVQLWTCRISRDYPYLHEQQPNYTVTDSFYSGAMRRATVPTKSYAPTHLSKAGRTALAGGTPDLFIVMTSPPQNGKVSAGASGVLVQQLVRGSKKIAIEINEFMPYTFGDTEIDLSLVDYVTYCNDKLDSLPQTKADERDKIIGKLVADKINDGDCLQVGIGAIPNALMEFLSDKKDLGIHTELLGDGLALLAQKGVVNGSKKTLHKGKIITATVDGSDIVFDFVNNNKDVLVMESLYTNDYFVLSQNDNQVSVNTALEIDLAGQCSSESLGSIQFSGTGGQAETAIGAQLAKNGRSFMVMHATATDKQGKEISKIVPQLKAGSTVSLQRNDVQFVATEYGMVNLRGLSVAARAKALISIAHPDFREQLTQQAKELSLLF